MVAVLQAQNAGGATTSATRSVVDVSISGIEEPEPRSSFAGHLYQSDAGHVRYIGPTFWASSFRSLPVVEGLLLDQPRQASEQTVYNDQIDALENSTSIVDQDDIRRREFIARLTSDAPPMKTHVAARASASVAGEAFSASSAQQSRSSAQAKSNADSIVRRLPAKEQCDRLLTAYTEACHPLMPVIHMSTFQQRYEVLWQQRSDSAQDSTAAISFVALAAAILYAGSVACPEAIASASTSKTRPQRLTAHLYRLAAEALRYTGFPRTASIDSFTAYILCRTTDLKREEPLASVGFVGLALRVATMLGLHQDPSQFPGLDAVEIEIRRRLWWQVVHVDVQVAIASGLPPMLDTKMWNVQPVSELQEEQFGMKNDPSAAAFLVDAAGILNAGKVRATLVLRDILASFASGKQSSTQELLTIRSKILLMEEDMAARGTRIHQLEDGSRLERLATLLLSAYVDDVWCTASGLIVSAAPDISQIWPDFRTKVQEHARSFLLTSSIITASSDLQKFHWSWPENHQPLQALAILLEALVASPHSKDADRSRHIIDIVFALCPPETGLAGAVKGPRLPTEAERTTWAFLRRLRVQAMEAAGLDSNILPTREQATRYCQQEPGPDLARPLGGSAQTSAHRRNELRLEPIDHAVPDDIDWGYLDTAFAGWQEYSDYGP